MTAISITDLSNAKLDVDHIADVSTSVALTSTDRLGNVKDTLTGAMYKVSAFNSRGAWTATTTYAIKDLVSNAGTWYVCVLAHTSSAAFAPDAATKWRVYQGVIAGDLSAEGGINMIGSNIIGNGVTDKSSAIFSANAAGQPLRFTGVSVVGTATTITVPIVDTMSQIFSTGSLITIDNGMPVRPEWFGSAAGNISLAVNALPATGGTVTLANKRYPPSYSTLTATMTATGLGVAGVDYLAKPNVHIVGTGQPLPAADKARLTDGSGSIIDGPFYVHASGFSGVGYGVDSGVDVCTARYGGSAKDTFAHVQINKASPVYSKGCHFDRLIGLAKGASDPAHGILIEAVQDFSIGEITGIRSQHGCVIKGSKGKIGALTGIDNGLEGVLIQSDDYAVTSNLTIDTIIAVDSNTLTGYAAKIVGSSSGIGNILVGKISANNAYAALGFGVIGGTQIISGCHVAALESYGCGTGIIRAVQTRACSVGRAQINNASRAAFDDPSTGLEFAFSIASLETLNCADIISSSGATIIDQLLSVSTSGYDITYQSTGARIKVGMHRRHLPATQAISASSPALINGWASYPGQSPFFVDLANYGVRFRGLLATSSGTLFTLPPQMRPSVPMAFPIGGRNGSAAVFGMLQVDTSGDVYIQATVPTASTWWSLEGVAIPSELL